MANDPPEMQNRVRFNHGYHDAAWDQKRGCPRRLVQHGPQSIEQVSHEFSRWYYRGYALGLADAMCGSDTSNSERAWLQQIAGLGARAAVEVATPEF